MTERDAVYLRILAFGLLRIRNLADAGLTAECQIEADHLHNVPSLVGESNENRHDDYYEVERVVYLERIDQTFANTDSTFTRYDELWRQLERLRNS